MFELLLWAVAGMAVLALILAWDTGRDILHPVFFLAPMFAFLYAWMPMQLFHSGALDAFFDRDQIQRVQTLNVWGVGAFLAGCLGGAWGLRHMRNSAPYPVTDTAATRLVIGGTIAGIVGLAAWLTSIHNVGGFVNAFSKSHAGGWDDSGYVRDSSLLLFSAVILIMSAAATRGVRLIHFVLVSVFALPWLAQSLLGSRRGPTFAIVTVLVMGWFLYRNTRPSSVTAMLGAVAVGYLILFLITNRDSIHLGNSDSAEFSTDVTSKIAATDTGNEYVYGAGSVISAQHTGKHFWGRRYLAQILVRPIPSAVWPTKYEDFGVPELLQNAGTGAAISEVMGWEGAPGSAPGIVADLYTEGAWLAVPFLAFLGWAYGRVWKLALTRGGPWAAQYAILSALSIYLVMQTMEAVIFRLLLLSIPVWLTWKWAESVSPIEAPVNSAYNRTPRFT